MTSPPPYSTPAPAAAAPDRPWRRWVGWLVAWGVLWGLILWGRARLGLAAPLGSDAALWGLSALALEQGQRPYGAPLYPTLVALLPAPVWWWGGVVSSACFAAVPPTMVVLLRREGAPWGLAAGLALLPLLSPTLGIMALQLQPDALTQLLLLAVLGAGLRVERTPGRGALLGWLGLAVLLALAREHGLVVLAALLGALLLRRGVPLWALLLLALLGGLVVWGGAEYLPTRLRIPLQSSPLGAGRYPLPEFLTHFRGARGRALIDAWEAGQGLTFWRLTLRAMLQESAPHLLLVGLGALGFGLARRGWSGSVTLAPTVTLLFFWSEARHAAVLVPAALVGVGLGLLRLQHRPARAVLVLLLAAGVGLSQARDWPRAVQRAQGAARHSRDLWLLAGELSDWAAQSGRPWLLAGLENEANLHLGWARHVPILPHGCLQTRWDGAAWSSIWIAPAALVQPPLQELLRVGHMAAYWLPAPDPTGPRPCAEVGLPAGPLYVRGLLEAEVVGTCEAEVAHTGQEGLSPCPDRR